MDEEQRKWSDQLQKNIGCSEFLKVFAIFLILEFLDVAMALIFKPSMVVVYLIFCASFLSLLAIGIITPRWRRVWQVYRKVIGNKNWPEEPMPRAVTKTPRQPLPWWSFIPGIWGWIITLIAMYLFLRLIAK